MSEDSRLTRLTSICRLFPEAGRKTQGDHASFLVRKRVFAYYLHDHHGDGIISVCAKTLPGDNVTLIAANPTKFYSPAYIGPRGWVGLRLDLGKIDWDEVKELIAGSYVQTAPKRLATLVKIEN
jgi:hypothetical protein